MLEVTIYKTAHRGIEDAEKLIDYFNQNRKPDVLSIEDGGLSVNSANKIIELWKLASKTKTFFETNPLIQNGLNKYQKRLFKFSITEKIPVFNIERFSPKISNYLRENGRIISQETGLAIIKYLIGEKKDGINTFYENYLLTKEHRVIRDKFMGENLSNIEQLILKAYSEHLEQGKLNFAIQIGARHKIEDFSNIPLNIIDLTEGKYTTYHELDSLLDKKKPNRKLINKKIEELIEGELNLDTSIN